MRKSRLIFLLALGAVALFAIGKLAYADAVVLALLPVALIPFVVLLMRKPELAVPVFVFVIYTNLAVIANKLYNVPNILAASFSVVLIIPIYFYVVKQQQKLVFDVILGLMAVFLTALLASSTVAVDQSIALLWIFEYLLEAMVLYFLVVNAIRNRHMLERAIWALLVACSLLGSLSLFQEVTGSYSNSFGGLAQKNKEEEELEVFEKEMQKQAGGEVEKVRGSQRAGGPVGKPNRYAQIMLVVLPLAFFKLRSERTRKLRLLAFGATCLIFAGILLSYSRGAFVTMTMLFLGLVALGYLRPTQLLKAGAFLAVAVMVAAPAYLTRLDTLRGVQGLFSDDAEVQADGPTRGRLTEMLSALLVFLDHPILGVGPGQYTPFYSAEYQNTDDIMFRYLGRNRRAHILYFELAAETGIIGIGTFFAIIGYILWRLWQIRGATMITRPDIASLATSLCFAIFGYLGTAVFLHLSYQRYLWFTVAICGAAIRVLGEEASQASSLARSSQAQFAPASPGILGTPVAARSQI